MTFGDLAFFAGAVLVIAVLAQFLLPQPESRLRPLSRRLRCTALDHDWFWINDRDRRCVRCGCLGAKVPQPTLLSPESTKDS